MAVPILRSRARARALPFLLAAFGALTCAGGVRAEEPNKLVELRLEWHTQQARLATANDESPAARVGAAGARNFPPAVLNQLRPILDAEYKLLKNAARRFNETAQTRRKETVKEWEEVYRQRIEFRKYTDEQQKIYKFDFDTGAQPVFQPEIFDAVAVVWAAVMFVIAVRMARHVRRVAIRKAERAAAAVLLFSLCTASGCTPGPTADARPWSDRESAKLAADVKTAKDQADRAVAEADTRWTKILDGWANLVAAPNAPGDPVEPLVRDSEIEIRKNLFEGTEATLLADRLATEAAAERDQLGADKAKLDGLTGRAQLLAIAYTAARCAFVGLLFGLAVSPFWRARRKETAQVKADAKRCPRCFGEKLIVEKRGAPPGTEEEDEEPRGRSKSKARTPKGRTKVKASAPTDAPTETGYVECKSCKFRFLRSYQKVHRLCFPVVGVRASGKTQMLATGYDRVRKRVAPTVAAVQPAPSLGDVQFEAYIDEIMNMKRATAATFHDMPYPVMLHVRDDDPAGANTALVNLFDYSGELVDQSIDVDRLKRQAVKMDGFMLFLDPTQLYGDGTNLSLDRQLARLNEFMADMREARGVPVGQMIPVPVAVVIPKFDLLLTENPIQGQSVPFIRHILREMNPPPKQTTLGTIEGRSEVVEQMLELMFRGVDIRELVESYFGSQIMFFPVSSVSLFENELGIKDLSKRTIAPFGVAEPFLWLLHMHGYEVFA